MSKSMSKNVIAKFILSLFNLIVPILIGPYVLRKLGPVNMGIIDYTQSIFSYFFIFASFGVYRYGIREISKNRNNKEKMEQIFTSLFIFSIITNVITSVVYLFFINKVYSGTEFYNASIMLTFNLFSNIFYTEWLNEGLENYSFITIKTIIVRIIYIVLLFVLVRGSENSKEYVFLLILSTFLNNVISYIYLRKQIKFNFKNIVILKHIKPMFLVVILSNANILYTQLDKIMIGGIDTASVSYYTTAQKIGHIINTLMLSVILVSIPRLNSYLANKKDGEYIKLLNKISRMYFFLLFPVSIGMLVLAKEAILIYAGNKFVDAIPVFAVFSIYIITLGFDSILSNQVMYVNGEERKQVQIFFIGGIFNLISNVILLKLNILNPATAVFTTLLANLIVIGITCYYIRVKLKIDFNILQIDKMKYMFISLLFIPITLVIRMFVSSVLMITIVTVLVNASVYFAILYFTKDDILIEFINKIGGKFKK